MMKYAKEAGYYTTCPLCDEFEPADFRREMRLKGIYIPDQYVYDNIDVLNSYLLIYFLYQGSIMGNY